MSATAIRPEIVDGALAIVVDPARKALAVWKGLGRIDLYDPSGSWHQVAPPLPFDRQGDWDRHAVISHGALSLESIEPPAAPATDSDPIVLVEPDDLQRSWLLRAKPWGYALWDGGENVDVYDSQGTHRRSVRVPATDLATLSHLMLDLLALIRREEDVAGVPR